MQNVSLFGLLQSSLISIFLSLPAFAQPHDQEETEDALSNLAHQIRARPSPLGDWPDDLAGLQAQLEELRWEEKKEKKSRGGFSDFKAASNKKLVENAPGISSPFSRNLLMEEQERQKYPEKAAKTIREAAQGLRKLISSAQERLLKSALQNQYSLNLSDHLLFRRIEERLEATPRSGEGSAGLMSDYDALEALLKEGERYTLYIQYPSLGRGFTAQQVLEQRESLSEIPREGAPFFSNLYRLLRESQRFLEQLLEINDSQISVEAIPLFLDGLGEITELLHIERRGVKLVQPADEASLTDITSRLTSLSALYPLDSSSSLSRTDESNRNFPNSSQQSHKLFPRCGEGPKTTPL